MWLTREYTAENEGKFSRKKDRENGLFLYLYFDFFEIVLTVVYEKRRIFFKKKKIGVLTKIAFLSEFDDSINQMFTLRKAGSI